MKKRMRNDPSGYARRRNKVIWASVLTLVLVAMSFTPLGYLSTGSISITFLPMIVVIGAIHAGPVCGLYLGTVFGITSFIHCFTDYQFGQELLAYNAFGTAVVCLFPRAMMGWSCGGIHRLFSRSCRPTFTKFIAAFCGGFLNTVFYSVMLFIFFGKNDCLLSIGDSGTAVLRSLISSNAVIEWVFCTVAGLLTPRIKNYDEIIQNKNKKNGESQASSKLDFFET